jgi:hypothetical protein
MAGLTLAEFLTARLAEDDAEALKLHDRLDGNVPLQRAFAARMLREVEAKRKILADLDLSYPDEEHLKRLLAAIYENHEDYDPAWKEQADG